MTNEVDAHWARQPTYFTKPPKRKSSSYYKGFAVGVFVSIFMILTGFFIAALFVHLEG